MKRTILLFLISVALLPAQDVRRYLLELQGDPAAVLVAQEDSYRDARHRRSMLEGRRGIVEREQLLLKRLLERRGITVQNSLDTLVNGLVIETDERTVRRLEQLRSVKAVHRVRKRQLDLEEAVKLQNVENAWWWIGPESAGKGIKIAILDTGIDTSHPMFQDPLLRMPPGYPRGNSEADLALTTPKVIVYRSYEHLYRNEGESRRVDCGGHGTSVATCAAGSGAETPMGFVSGVAPKAYLGAYKVFPRCKGEAWDDVLMRAMEDAIRDGMDVINLSLGEPRAGIPEADLMQLVTDRASALGVVVVWSAGNEGSSPATIGASGKIGESSLTVGASENGRSFVTQATVDGVAYKAVPGDGEPPAAPVRAPLMDVSRLDSTGLACEALPDGSLIGNIALIFRGTCNFTVKLANARIAGAVGALVYTHGGSVVTMAVHGEPLPAMMISNEDGLAIKARIPEGGTLPATLDFAKVRVEQPDNAIVGFSSRGPGPYYLIKPDMVAIGDDVYMAKSRHVGGEAGTYKIAGGTSFSAPQLAGAAAVLMAVHPNLTPRQIKSLLVNSAEGLRDDTGRWLGVMDQGSGRLDLERAVRATLTAWPTSLSFGADPKGPVERKFVLTNIGIHPERLVLNAEPRDPGAAPTITPSIVALAPRQSRTITVRFSPAGLTPATYQGFIEITGKKAGARIHLPYWMGIGSGIPISFTKYWHEQEGEANETYDIYIRVNDEFGIGITAPLPNVTVQEGNGKVEDVFVDALYPEVIAIRYKLGDSEGWHCLNISTGDQVTTECIKMK